MPAISLVVCVYRERDLLKRLLEHSAGCYDELIVVHDGPDAADVRAVVESAGGRFFEASREYQQEPHWPFAWGKASHDWILRLDADEFPGDDLKTWLQEFRHEAEPSPELSGYTCSWPLWNGRRAVSQKWPRGRTFLFQRQRVRFFGMVEQIPVPDGHLELLDMALCHQPRRKSYGVVNVVFRRQSYHWRECIARSLLGTPDQLVCWRWETTIWPPVWEEIRRRPLSTAVHRLLMETLRGMRDQWRTERQVFPFAALSGPLHHGMICLKYWQMRRARNVSPAKPSAKP